jgi:ParB-like nuclease domain
MPALQEAAMDGSNVPHIESEKRFGQQSRDRGMPPLQRAELAFLAIPDLRPDPRNPRKHDRVQIRAIARSIEAFGFNAPILIDKHKQIIAGHGRLEAAKLNGYTYAPVICVTVRTCS